MQKEDTMKYLFEYLNSSEAVYTGKVAETIDFTIKKQLNDKALWKKFANQFRIRLDSNDLGWRGEYWGKMMRGGCLIYRYRADEELYDTLTFAVEELLKTIDEFGRIEWIATFLFDMRRRRLKDKNHSRYGKNGGLYLRTYRRWAKGYSQYE